MDKSCYLTGSCKICGCKTTALQMANKSCDAPCYPVLMGRKRWRDFKRGLIYREKNSEYIWAYSTRKDGPKKMVRIKLADYVDKSAFRVGTD